MTTPLLRQGAIQSAAAFTVLSLLWPYHGFALTPAQWPLVVLAIGISAGAISAIAGHPWWWRLIHFSFAPLAWAVAQIQIEPIWFLLAFFILFSLFRGAASGQIPLYLSGSEATEALASLLEKNQRAHFVDLGAGIGSTIIPLANRYPDHFFVGVENSPLTWFIGWIRTRGLRNIEWRWGNLWQTELHEFNLVYAFLSPAPMIELAEKAGREMQIDAIFVSNSFAIPDLSPNLELPVGARCLYLYTAENLNYYSKSQSN